MSLQTKIRLYNTLVISVLLYGSETWTLLKGDERRLEAFHINCQRWFHFVTNACHSPNWRRRLSNPDLSEATHHFWSRAATTGSDTRPLRTTPGCGVWTTRAGGKSDIRPEWKHQHGRPCRTWVQQIEDDTGLNANDGWRIAHDRKSWRALRHATGQSVGVGPVKRSSE